MSNHTFKEWFLATRPWSFPASAMPVAVTMAYCFYLTSSGDSAPVGPSQWAYSIVALISMILFQAVGNVWSDLRDFKRGGDNLRHIDRARCTVAYDHGQSPDSGTAVGCHVACVVGMEYGHRYQSYGY